MAKHRDLNPGDTLYASILDAQEEYISASAENVRLTLTSGTVVSLAASAGSGQVTLGIGGLWRYNTAAATATHPGGAAGNFDVLAVASANIFGTGEADTTDYSFGLQIVASGASPTGNYNARAITVFRKIAELRWDGSQITRLRHTLYTMANSQHHPQSPRTGLDIEVHRDSTGVERFRIKEDGSWDIADATGTFQAGVGLNGTALKATQAFQSAGDITARHAGTTSVIGNLGPASEPALQLGGDSTWYRSAASTLRTTSTVRGTVDFIARDGGGTSEVAMGNFGPASQAALRLGGDTSWYRLSASTMRTDGSISAGSNITSGAVVNAVSGYQVNGTALASTHLSDSSSLARLAGPAFTGVPTAPTAAVNTNTTQIATTAWVINQGYATIAGSGYAPLNNPTFTGTFTAPNLVTTSTTVKFWGTAGSGTRGTAINLLNAPARPASFDYNSYTLNQLAAFVLGIASDLKAQGLMA